MAKHRQASVAKNVAAQISISLMVTDGWYPYHWWYWWLISDIRIIDGWCINEHWNVYVVESVFQASARDGETDVLKTSCLISVPAALSLFMAAKGWGAVSKQDTLDKYSMLYAGLCLNNSQLVVVGLVLFAFFCHTFQMLQQRLDTYDLWHFHQFQWFQFTSSTQILSTHGSIQNCYWGAHAIGSGPLADWIAALDFHRSQFQWGFTMGLTWSCALWIKPVGCQTFTASSVTRVAKCGLLGIWRFYPCLFGIIMIGGPWWPRFFPQVSMAAERCFWGRGLSHWDQIM